MKKQTKKVFVVVCSYSFILFDILFQLVLERRRASLSVYLRRGSLSCRPLVVAVGRNYLVYYSSCHLPPSCCCRRTKLLSLLLFVPLEVGEVPAASRIRIVITRDAEGEVRSNCR